jgi:hypothetical protein
MATSSTASAIHAFGLLHIDMNLWVRTLLRAPTAEEGGGSLFSLGLRSMGSTR